MSHPGTPMFNHNETNPHFITQQQPQVQPQLDGYQPQKMPLHPTHSSQPTPQLHGHSPQQTPRHHSSHPHQTPQLHGHSPQQTPRHHGSHPHQTPLHPGLHPQRNSNQGGQHAQQGRSRHRPQGLRVPVSSQRRTKPLIWSIAVFFLIFGVVIIVGGLIVLIIYLLFRPHSPLFDVPGMSLNAAYLDMGYLLNADVRLLANFTNSNRKVKVDFSHLVINLYYGNTLLTTQRIAPFSASKHKSRFADVHLVASQVRLPIKDAVRLSKQIQNNSVMFDVRGIFRTRSSLGNVLRYSYNLYSHCILVVTAPPNGVLVSKRCRTKR